MKNHKETICLFLALLCVWCPLSMAAWDKDKPSSSTSLRASNPEILANWSALETSFGAFHEYSTGGSNTGENLSIKFNAPISTPTNAANKLWIYSKDVNSVVEAHILDESGNELQITSGGDLFSSAGLTITGASTLNGSITLGAGDDLIGSSTSDITFNTNKFTVAGATGNTVIAGTCDITGATEVTGVATLGDGSLLKTSAAPSTEAMIANKKYVDDNVGSANWTPTSYAGEQSVTFPNGLILKQGIVTSVGAGAVATVTFDVAFGTVKSASCENLSTTSIQSAHLDTFNTTTIKMRNVSVTTTTDIHWQAWGY